VAKDVEIYLIFGAAVRPDGSPSGTLKRRVETALRPAGGAKAHFYLCSGGVGRSGPSEAEVMRRLLLDSGVSPEDIIMDNNARDTLDTVRNARRILTERGLFGTIVVCTSTYHQPRCVLLLRFAGLKTRPAGGLSDRVHVGNKKWLYFVARELPAIIWDTFFAIYLRFTGRL